MAAYRNDLDALTARHAALSSELAQKTKELDDASRLLTDAKAKAKLPVLDNIRVASPCPAAWKDMTGDDRVRACGDCNKSVYNLSDMTRDEAQSLLIEKEGKLCVRYFQRSDGTILLKDCSIGIGRKRKRRLIAAGATALLASGAVFAYKTATKGESAPLIEIGGEPTFVVPPATHEQHDEQVRPADPEMYEVAGGIGAPPDEHIQVDVPPSPPAPTPTGNR